MSAERPRLLLKPHLCDACGRCVEECRHNAIRVGLGYIYVDWSRCDGCGKCVAYCDREALADRDGSGGVAAQPAVSGVPGRAAVGPRWKWPKPASWRSKAGHGSPAAAQADEGGDVAWGSAEAAVVLVAAVLLQVAMQLLLASEVFGPVPANGIMVVRGVMLGLYYVIMAGLLAGLAARRRSGFARAFRLDAPPDLLSIPLGFAMLAGTWLFARLYGIVAISSGFKPPAADSANLETLFGTDVFGVAVSIGVLVLLGPLVEELMLRGVVLGALEGRFKRWTAVGLSAGVFAVLHGSLWSFLPMCVLGLALGRIAYGRRSLWPAILLHVAYNAAIVAPAFLASKG